MPSESQARRSTDTMSAPGASAQESASWSLAGQSSALESVADRAKNMQVWSRVCVTDPTMTKHVSYGKRSFTAIDPQSQLLQATELWGPYGDRWGMRDMRWSTVPVTEMSTALVLDATFFYPSQDGRVISFQIINDDVLKAGDDVFKKMVTNTRSKALSWLGFGADVFMGKFDDVEYVKGLRVRFADLDALSKRVLGDIRAAKTVSELDAMVKKIKTHPATDTISQELSDEFLEEIEERAARLKGGEPHG